MESEKVVRRDEISTFQELLDLMVNRGDRAALLVLQEQGIEQWSYRDLAETAERLATGLNRRGIESGNVVALMAKSQPTWIVVALAVLRAGAVILPIDEQLGEQTLAHILKDGAPRILFTTSEHTERIESLGLEEPPEVFLLDAQENDPRDWRQVLASSSENIPKVPEEELAALFYTSGTTGLPKGVPLSHKNLIFQLRSLAASDLVHDQDRVLLPLPLHHVYPFVIGVLVPLGLGLPLILPQGLTGPQVVRALREAEATVIIGVPRLYRALYSAIMGQVRSRGRLAQAVFQTMLMVSIGLRRYLGLRVGRKLFASLHQRIGPSLRLLASGGSALSPELAWRLEGLGWKIGIGYGLTETAPLLTLNLPDQFRTGSVGWPLPGVEVRVDPGATSEDAQGQGGLTEAAQVQGEVLARGPNVFSGYRSLPEQTQEVLSEDGWYRTGDLGYFDSDGYLHLLGRRSTLIVTEGGKNIQPDEVEEAYQQSPAIAEIGVLQRDQQLVGLIVPDLKNLDEAAKRDLEPVIREAVAKRSRTLPSYQRLSNYTITREALARTRLGKIQRHKLVERYEQALTGEDSSKKTSPGPIPLEEMSSEDRSLLEQSQAREAWDWLARRYADRRLTPDTSLQLDLGVDSMEWLELTIDLGEQVGVELSEETIAQIDTVRDLLIAITEAGKAESASVEKLVKDPERVLSERQKRWLRPLSRIQAALAWLLFIFDRVAMRGLFRLQVEGREKLPEGSPFLLAPNHISYLDPFVVAAALGYRRLRGTYWGGWVGAAFRNPITRWVSRLAQAVPLDPERGSVSSLALGAAVLQRRHSLVWFPEGGRSRTGELQPLKPGIGILAEHFEVTIVPAFIHGAYEAMPPGRRIPRLFQRIRIVFDDPVTPAELEQEGEGDSRREQIISGLAKRLTRLGESSKTP